MKIKKEKDISGTNRMLISIDSGEIIEVYKDITIVYFDEENVVSIPTSILRDILNCDYLKEEGKEEYKPGDFVRVTRQGGHDFKPYTFIKIIRQLKDNPGFWIAESGVFESRGYIHQNNFTKP